ncbi:hypothetical protein O181_125307 [Austropuccinia psidii MF-1]|uniref:Uncharacterized protein n=1 Tax=Austropuccinia psidii MF-1 TaxID=1389203 RepID=A0A9Q3Q7B8_9BASI|nr:hypothetical protein [Austropuccinia psidii MF-1]
MPPTTPTARGPRSAGQFGPFWPNPMRPKGAKGGNHLAPRPGGSQTTIGHQSLGPKIGQRPVGHHFGHKSRRTQFWPWPLAATRGHQSAHSAFPSTYGEFFPFLHTICT